MNDLLLATKPNYSMRLVATEKQLSVTFAWQVLEEKLCDEVPRVLGVVGLRHGTGQGSLLVR